MDSNSLALAFAIGIAFWVLMRMRRRRGKSAQQAPAPAGAGPSARTMPRFGKAGTITFNQIKALRRNNFVPDKTWSREEAALILDAVAYLRAVCRTVADDDDGPPPLEVQNELLRIILTTEDVRDYVRRWGEARREAGLDEFADDDPELAHNNQFERVAKAARKHLVATQTPAAKESAGR